MVIRKFFGPSPLGFGLKKARQALLIRGGQEPQPRLQEDPVFETYVQEKPRRMTDVELRDMYKPNAKLSKQEKLVKSVLDDCISVSESKNVPPGTFQSLQDLYDFRRKYRHYLRLKRFIPICLVAPFTTSELSKMAYAAAIGANSISFTLPGLVGYSLPSFFFFHMSSYYVPDKVRPLCVLCKYTVGAPFWIANSLTDGLLSGPEETFFGEEVPIDITQTGGTIPAELTDFEGIKEALKAIDVRPKKSYLSFD
jgi:hypothetical protein